MSNILVGLVCFCSFTKRSQSIQWRSVVPLYGSLRLYGTVTLNDRTRQVQVHAFCTKLVSNSRIHFRHNNIAEML